MQTAGQNSFRDRPEHGLGADCNDSQEQYLPASNA